MSPATTTTLTFCQLVALMGIAYGAFVPSSTGTCKEYGCKEQWEPGQFCQCYPECVHFQTCCVDYKTACAPPGPPPPPPPGKPGSIVWRATEYGPGTSGTTIDNEPPIIDNGTIYFISAAQLWTVYALDAKTGEERWISRELNVSDATAVAVANGTLYYASAIRAASGYGTPRLHALDAATGEEHWQLELGPGELHDKPTVVDGVIYIVMSPPYSSGEIPPDTLFAIKNNSYVLWKTNVSGTSSQVAVADGVAYVTASDNAIYAYNATDGYKLWHTPEISNQWSTPVIGDGLLFTSEEQGRLHAVDALTGVSVWNTTFEGYNAMAPTLVNNILYLAGAFPTLYAFNAKTGAQVWNVTNLCPGHLWSSPVVYEETVYVGSDQDGVLHVLEASTGKSKWNFTADDAVRTPLVADGLVYFGVNSPMSPGSIDQMYALMV